MPTTKNKPVCPACGSEHVEFCQVFGHIYPIQPERSACLVPFCRKVCPVLPDGAVVNRASGECVCPSCGKTYDHHPTYAYPSGMKHVVLACDGTFLHL